MLLKHFGFRDNLGFSEDSRKGYPNPMVPKVHKEMSVYMYKCVYSASLSIKLLQGSNLFLLSFSIIVAHRKVCISDD